MEIIGNTPNKLHRIEEVAIKAAHCILDHTVVQQSDPIHLSHIPYCKSRPVTPDEEFERLYRPESDFEINDGYGEKDWTRR